MKTTSLLWITAMLLLLASCSSDEVQTTYPDLSDSEALITEDSLMDHIHVLASDEFEGRAPATRGDELTIRYITDQLRQIGVQPGMPDGSYFQEMPMAGQVVDGGSASFAIKTAGGETISLDYRTEFMAWPANQSETVDVSNAELLYVGYGIQAPEYEWDDYKGEDVAGKVLIYKNSDPSHDPDLFEGDSRLYYGRWSYKFEKAEEMGALGAIIIHTEPTAGYGWNIIVNSWGRERFSLRSGDSSAGKPEFSSWLTTPASETLFSEAGLDLNEMLEAADDIEFHPVPLEGVTVDVALNAEYSQISSGNIVGVIEGNDPDLKDEYLIFSAHYDHLGITEPVEGDSINNGAHDNAAGVSALLNLANAYQAEQEQMRRSALFFFAGAEEMGLLGSQYWAENPTVHPGKVTANFNMDGMQVYGETGDVVLVGYGRNTITDVMRDFAEKENRIIQPDPNPQQGFFYRSDHFNFAKVGIPAIFPNPGRDYIGKPDDWNAVVDSVTAHVYHSVFDEVNEYWDPAGLEKDVRLFFRTSFHILNMDEMMEWESGDEFEAVRKEMLEEAETL
ncbi:MAG TPA: M28 family peptidase [Balneolaceae bacterium]|nr:M28 family peptidase [Balneolaceae bacterium]